MKNPLKPTLGLALLMAALFSTGCPPVTDSGSSFEPVTGISGVPAAGTVGAVIDLSVAKVIPENATHQAISWAVVQAGGTGVTTAGIVNNKFTPSAAGSLVLSASVENGKEEGLKYTREFTIKIESEKPAVTYTATANGANGTETTTALALAFSEAIELAADDITVANGTGAVTKGNLAVDLADGKIWTLALTVGKAGDITVSVAKNGVESGAKTVTVYKEGEVVDLTWTAQANGAADTTASTAITFTFSGAVTGLTASDITVTAGTGEVTKGDLADDPADGKIWTLTLTAVTRQGNIKVSVNKAGIKAEEKTVNVYKQGLTWEAAANGVANTTTSTIITFTFSEAVTGLTAADITVTGDTGAVTKGNLAVDPADGKIWTLTLTAVAAQGNVKVSVNKAGITAEEKTVAVYKLFVAVTGISGVPEESAPGKEVDLGGAQINPTNATAAGAAISWTVKSAGGTGVTTAGIVDNKFTPANAGTLVLTASVANGEAAGTPYTKDFTITIQLPAGTKKPVTAAGISFNQIYVPAVTDGFVATDDGFEPKITKGYWMGETEVTRELWQAVMTGTANNAAPSDTTADTTDSEAGTAGTFPVENITWYDCMEFCNALSGKTGKDAVYTITDITRNAAGYITAAGVTWDVTKNGYRLPTIAEWMWAAMGATKGGDTVKEDGYEKPFAGGGVGESIDNYVWYRTNSGRKIHHVRLKLPNELDLYDMCGNIDEWVWDQVDTSSRFPYTGYSGTGVDYRSLGDNVADSSVTIGALMGRYYDTSGSASFVLKSINSATKASIAKKNGIRVVCGE